MKAIRNLLVALSVALSAVFAPTVAFAQNTTDYTTLTTAVNWSSAITAMMAVAALVAAVLVVRKGIGFVLGMLKR